MRKDIFRKRAEVFLREALLISQKEGLDLRDHWDIDHLCFRTASVEEYKALCKTMLELSTCLIESPVNGRLISTFKLHEPLIVDGWRVDLIEVPAPKPGRPVHSGFEHLEVVCDEPFESLQARFPNLKWDHRGLEKLWNQELEVSFSNFAIKFHHLSLESVVTLESNAKVFSALMESRVLEKLKPLKPLIAGTFPLGIHNETSDIDVLAGTTNLDEAEEYLKEEYRTFNDLKIKRELTHGQPNLLCSFTFQEVPFEIFVQEMPAIEQVGYRHFLVEEKILKWGGFAVREKVLSAREKGLKTEPAFAEALSITRDPYKELLFMQKKSNADLAALFKIQA